MQRSTTSNGFESVPLAALRLGSVSKLHDQARSMGLEWLSSDERQHLEGMRSDRRQQQFLAGHWLARCLAAQVLGDEPLQWTIRKYESGAPFLCAPKGIDASKHSISISHCADRVSVALACFPVGVDIQGHKPRNFIELAALAFPVEVRDELAGLDAEMQERCFYQRWSIKEAIYKRSEVGRLPRSGLAGLPMTCSAEKADILAWQFEGFSLALAGSKGISAQSNVPMPAVCYWRTGESAEDTASTGDQYSDPTY